MTGIRHGHLELALHELASGPGLPLLLVHELGSDSRSWTVEEMTWPGPLYALDLSGHGESDRARGGAYLPEYWAGDIDAVLAEIGPAAVLGAGVGAYCALLVAGARPEVVPVVGLLPGAGLKGGGSEPHFDRGAYRLFVAPEPLLSPFGADTNVAISEGTIRSPEYVVPLARRAAAFVLADDGGARPEWWQAVAPLPQAVLVRGGSDAVVEAMLLAIGNGLRRG